MPATPRKSRRFGGNAGHQRLLMANLVSSLVAAEAMACGTPVIAFGKGGATETVKEGITGFFFDRQTPENLVNAIQRFEKVKLDPKKIRSHALTFDDMVFKRNFHALVEREWKKHKAK